jgi:hypothetical protein
MLSPLIRSFHLECALKHRSFAPQAHNCDVAFLVRKSKVAACISDEFLVAAPRRA